MNRCVGVHFQPACRQTVTATLKMAQTRPVNDLTHRRWGPAIKGCATVLALALLALLAQMGYAVWQTTHSAGTETAGPAALELPADARALVRLGRAAMGGAEVEGEFARTRSKIAADVQALSARLKHTAPLQGRAGHLFSTWDETDAAASQLHDQLSALQEMATHYTHFFEQLPAIKTHLDALARHMVSSGSVASQVYLALHQLVLIDEMARQVDTIRSSGDAAAQEATELAQEIAAFDRVLTGLRHGDTRLALRRLRGQKNLAALAQVEAQWARLRPLLDIIAQQAPARRAAQSALTALERGADAMLIAASSPSAIEPHPLPMVALWPGSPWTGLASVMVALLAGAGLWQALSRRRHRWAEQAAQLRHREQDAFAQLLDEMGALAEGDLTVKATFSEDATGALADAINFISQQLSARIQTMTDAIAPMPVQVDQARQMAIRLSEVSQYQTQELSAAEAKVQQMSTCLEAVLALLAAPARSSRQKALNAAQECAHLAADLSAMIETVHTVSTQLADEAGKATPVLERLVQSSAALREAADGFILPS